MAPMFKRRSATIAELDDQISSELERLPDEALRAVAPALREAREELKRNLEQWLGTHADGKERFTAFRYRQALRQIETALKKVDELEPALFGALKSSGAKAGKKATDHTVKQLDRYSKIFEGSAYPLPLNEAAAIANANSFLIPHYRTSAKRYVGNVRDDIKQQLAIGVLKGETIDELTDRLVKHGGPKGWVALRGVKGERGARVQLITEGLFKRYRYWAERVVRTEVMSAYNTVADASIRQLAKDDGELRRRWNSAADWRLCPICHELDGQIAKVDEPFKGGYVTAPAHPNCRCNVGPWKERWQTEAQQEADERVPESNRIPQVTKKRVYLDGKAHDEYVRRISTPEALALSDIEFQAYAKRVREELGLTIKK